MKNPKLVLFDLDGTLVKGSHVAGSRSFIGAIKEVTDINVSIIDWTQHDGSIDNKIFKDLTKDKIALQSTHLLALHQARIKHYFTPEVTKEYSKSLIPGVKQLLVKLQKHNICLGLLTGNSQKMAYTKLQITGIDKYFDFGLFGDMDASNRQELAKLVFRKAKEHFKTDFLPENIFIIGDTPKDVACGKAVGVKTIAVASGFPSLEDLQKTGADLVVSSLADPKVLKFILR
jgi:phosphoglycolate phosphatase